MFTGIVQGVATIGAIDEKQDLRTLTLKFPGGFGRDLQIGASVAVDGVCLTVTHLSSEQTPDSAQFDVMLQTLNLSTLRALRVGDQINVERAAKDGAEIGGHPLSGHVDFMAQVATVEQRPNNHRIRFSVPPPWMRYIFAKGYIALNGASLTVAQVDRQAGWFDVWLIPETLRMTTFGQKTQGDWLNVEIERATQVMVDTVRDTLHERLGPLMPALERLLEQQMLEESVTQTPDQRLQGKS